MRHVECIRQFGVTAVDVSLLLVGDVTEIQGHRGAVEKVESLQLNKRVITINGEKIIAPSDDAAPLFERGEIKNRPAKKCPLCRAWTQEASGPCLVCKSEGHK